MVYFARPRKWSLISPKSMLSTFTKMRILVELDVGKFIFETSPRYLMSYENILAKAFKAYVTIIATFNQKSAISKMSIILHEIFLWFIIVREVM